MKTDLASEFVDNSAAQQAAALIRACVHCGFCTATCPTYQLLGDERDSPRGRIYLIQQMLEGQPVTRTTQQHLDRCLTCRSCESTCPSGVQYSHLLDIGRELVEQRVPRPLPERYRRAVLNQLLPRRGLFAAALLLGRKFKPFLLPSLQRSIPDAAPLKSFAGAAHSRKLLLLDGCVQPALAPDINVAARKLFAAVGIEALALPAAGCCGAVSHHLHYQQDGRAQMRRLIDACWPQIEAGIEAIVMTASGCGSSLKDYGFLLRDDSAYAARARRFAALVRDPLEVLEPHAALLREQRRPSAAGKLVFQSPCSLQHGQKLSGRVEALLSALGLELAPVADGHMCCGSAGTYSMLQPELAVRLKADKLAKLGAGKPTLILSANIGCICHLQVDSPVPVRHWLAFVADQIPD